MRHSRRTEHLKFPEASNAMIRKPVRIYAEPQVLSMSTVVRGCALVASRGPEPKGIITSKHEFLVVPFTGEWVA